VPSGGFGTPGDPRRERAKKWAGVRPGGIRPLERHVFGEKGKTSRIKKKKRTLWKQKKTEGGEGEKEGEKGTDILGGGDRGVLPKS